MTSVGSMRQMVRLALRLHVLLTLLLATLLAGGAHAAQALKFCYEQADIRPWSTRDGKGLNFDLINAVALKLGVQVSYEGLPWKRCLAELKANTVDGVFGASFKVDRMEMGAYPGGSTPDESKRLHVERYVAVRKKTSSVRWDGKTFSGLDGSIGTQLGYSVVDQLKAMNHAVDDASANLRELLLKLVAGRVGVAAALGSEVQYAIKQDPSFANQLEVLAPPIVEKSYYLMLSHRVVESDPALAQRFWKTIEVVRSAADYRNAEERALQGMTP